MASPSHSGAGAGQGTGGLETPTPRIALQLATPPSATGDLSAGGKREGLRPHTLAGKLHPDHGAMSSPPMERRRTSSNPVDRPLMSPAMVPEGQAVSFGLQSLLDPRPAALNVSGENSVVGSAAPSPPQTPGLAGVGNDRLTVGPNPWPEPGTDLSAKVVAIFTSGGDAPGMNAAVRSAAAVLLSLKVKVYCVINGYAGLVAGGAENIRKLDWGDLANILRRGGTSIGSARCQEFREKEGRLKAAANLLEFGINSLLAIGGDGSLTGVHRFKTEWSELLQTLVAEGRLSQETATANEFLPVVGMVGSIDNDMCGFSMTIGCDSALHRIVAAIDALATTAASHQRTFVVEVMGRNCGYLAIMASLACEADFVLVPESPPDCEDWESMLCTSLTKRRKTKPWSLVILAEGATDRVRRPISADYVKDLISKRLGHDTRITCLGHVQRGGSPSAYDRVLATTSGAEAALAVLNADNGTPARIVGVRWNQMVQVDLTDAVSQTKQVGTELENRDFEKVMRLRGQAFRDMMRIFINTKSYHPPPPAEGFEPFRVLLLHVGSPAAGMNAAVKVMTQELLNGGHVVLGAREGFRGLAKGDVAPLEFSEVQGWQTEGATRLGTNRTTPLDLPNGLQAISEQLEKHKVQSIMIVGGFEAFISLVELQQSRKDFEAFRIPMGLVPATISNNVPGTDFSLGADTALNSVVECLDKLKQSGSSSRRRVFIVETMGSYCGYLASMGALAGGADAAYTHEEGVRIDRLAGDIGYIREKFKTFSRSVILVRNENCSANYDVTFMKNLFEEEGKPDPRKPNQMDFSVRCNVLGHLLQGGAPSPLDRVRGSRLGAGAVKYLIRQMSRRTKDGMVRTMEDDSVCVIGIRNTHECATPIKDLIPMTDFHFRVPVQNWWLPVTSLIRVLENSRQEDDPVYQGRAIVVDVNAVPTEL